MTQEHEGDVARDGPEPGGVSRRGFLVGAAGLTGVALSGVWRGSPARAVEDGGVTDVVGTGRAGGYRFLEIEGEIVGMVKSVFGGDASAEVLEDPPSGTAVRKKVPGRLKWENIVLKRGLTMSLGMSDWIKRSFDHNPARVNGAIVAADFDLNARSRREFQNAVIEEVSFPALDASGKDPAYMTLTLRPELTRDVATSGRVAGRPSNQDLFLPSNFRLTLGQLPTAKVKKIDSLTVTQSFAGGSLFEPTSLEYPNLSVELPDSPAWRAWFDDFLIRGNSGDDRELSGKIELLSPDLKSTLVAIGLSHVGIVGLAAVLPEPNAQAVPRVRAELYCEEMTFTYRPSV